MALTILLIEDDPFTRILLVQRMEQEFPRATIESVETAEHARERIVSCSRELRALDCIVQDFKVPASPGENPEVDTTIWKCAVEHVRQSYFVYITAFPDDEVVLHHLSEGCRDPGNLIPKVIGKTVQCNWANELIEFLRTPVQKERVQREFNRWFPSAGPPADFLRRSGNGDDADLHCSVALASLFRDLEDYWAYFDDEFRAWVRQRIHVEDGEGGKVLIGLR